MMKRTLEQESLGSLPKKVACTTNQAGLKKLKSQKEVKLVGAELEKGRGLSSTGRPEDSKGGAMVRKKEGVGILPFECNICRCSPIPNNEAHIARHKSGMKHRRLQELMEKKNILEAWGIVPVEEAKVSYLCVSCDLKMELSFQKMERHFKAVHELLQSTSEIPTLEIPTLEILTLEIPTLEVTKVI